VKVRESDALATLIARLGEEKFAEIMSSFETFLVAAGEVAVDMMLGSILQRKTSAGMTEEQFVEYCRTSYRGYQSIDKDLTEGSPS